MNEREITQEELNNIASTVIMALGDNRVMLPGSATEAFTDLKTILRQLIRGELVLMPAPPTPDQAKQQVSSKK
jgi:hypothetical protein